MTFQESQHCPQKFARGLKTWSLSDGKAKHNVCSHQADADDVHRVAGHLTLLVALHASAKYQPMIRSEMFFLLKLGWIRCLLRMSSQADKKGHLFRRNFQQAEEHTCPRDLSGRRVWKLDTGWIRRSSAESPSVAQGTADPKTGMPCATSSSYGVSHRGNMW